MNYYPFHIGDYLSATRHLSWEEDAAFRRLLDTYYTSEKPLPVDVRSVCRLVVATTDVQREAVSQVLQEFFELTDAGWVNHRADEEIESMRDKQVLSENRDAHEKERMRRHRERRAQMFEALRAVSVIPAWDVPMKELQRLFDTHCNATGDQPETDLQREQVISGQPPATAIPTPTPTPTPTPVFKEGEGASPPSPAKRAPTLPKPKPDDVSKPDDVDPQTWADWLKLRRSKSAPVTQTVLKGAISEAEKAAMSLEEFLQIWCRRGSQGLEADWLKPNERPQVGRQVSVQTSRVMSFAEQDLQADRERLARLTGKPLPAKNSPYDPATSMQHMGTVIDVSPQTLEIAQ